MSETDGLLDTSVVIALSAISRDEIPAEASIAAITLAELAAGPAAATDAETRARRQALLQAVEAEFDVLPFDTSCSRAYGLVYAATVARGRKPRGAIAVDMLIAATALANGLALHTANPDDFSHLRQLLTIRPVNPKGAE